MNMAEILDCLGLKFADRVCIICKEQPAMPNGLLFCEQCFHRACEDIKKEKENESKKDDTKGHDTAGVRTQ